MAVLLLPLINNIYIDLLYPNKIAESMAIYCMFSTTSAIVVNGTIYGDQNKIYQTILAAYRTLENIVQNCEAARSDYLKDQQNAKSIIVLVGRAVA